MVHRRLTTDGDQKGVGEPLNDSSVVRTRQHLMFEDPSSGIATIREYALRQEHPPVILASISSAANSISWSPMKTELPDNIHLSTLQVQYWALLLFTCIDYPIHNYWHTNNFTTFAPCNGSR